MAHTETLTVKLWDHIERHPGLTVDELVDAAREGNMIPPSLNREYATYLNGSGGVARSTPPLHHEPWTVDPTKAERFMVRRALGQMRKYGSIRRDDEGRHFTARPIRRRGIGALVQPPEVVRADMLLRQLRIEIGRFLDKDPNSPRMPRALRSVMTNWYQQSRHEYFEAQNGDAAEVKPV